MAATKDEQAQANIVSVGHGNQDRYKADRLGSTHRRQKVCGRDASAPERMQIPPAYPVRSAPTIIEMEASPAPINNPNVGCAHCLLLSVFCLQFGFVVVVLVFCFAIRSVFVFTAVVLCHDVVIGWEGWARPNVKEI